MTYWRGLGCSWDGADISRFARLVREVMPFPAFANRENLLYVSFFAWHTTAHCHSEKSMPTNRFQQTGGTKVPAGEIWPASYARRLCQCAAEIEKFHTSSTHQGPSFHEC